MKQEDIKVKGAVKKRLEANTEPKKNGKTVENSTNLITDEDAAQWEETLKEYVDGKKLLDQKVKENQEWWRQRHWDQIQKKDESKKDDEKPASAWLFNSIVNKHADIMDNYPKPNILPREEDDTEEAQKLSKIIPVILEQNDYEKVYDDTAFDFLVSGGDIVGVFRDSDANDGLGGSVIKQVDILNLFWQPGVTDIQDSAMVFNVSLEDNDVLKATYPDIDLASGSTLVTTEYYHEDYIKKDEKTAVVDVYYKVVKNIPAIQDPVTGEWITKPKTILHLAKICNGKLLFASENIPEMENGFYEHGQYPFIVSPLFPIKDSVWGFGYVDVMKNPQMYIDALDQIITKNAFMVAQPRWFIKDSASINENDFADWSKPIVKVAGGNMDEITKQIKVDSVPPFVVNHLMNKKEELKETSNNRDFSQGGVASGVTAASAIAALQEAGSKTARDMIRRRYRSFQKVAYLLLELERQFGNQPQSYRIDDQNGEFEFITHDNSGLIKTEERPDGTVTQRKAIFDIKIVAEKQSPFSRAAQNETAKELYGMGLFSPNMAEPALICLDMMEFEGKDSIKKQVQENSQMLQQMNAMAQAIMQTDALIPELQLAARAGLAQPQAQPQPQGKKSEGTAEERAAKTTTEGSHITKARTKAASQAVPR